MRRKSSLVFYVLVVLLTIPLHSHAFWMDLDGRIITDWQEFRKTVELYSSNIKIKENIEGAARAEEQGKNFFLEGRYEQAHFLGYGRAIDWIPRPEYYFIEGDISLRMKLSMHSDSPHAPLEYKSCWDKYLFAMNVKEELESKFQTGFGLVEELNLSETRDSKIYKQSMANASCLAKLTSKYSEGVGPQCVPVEEVKACLGTPLLFLYH
ncbi:hypothetical protein [Pseudomonas protegens]|uniref:hypothetical protein n=1 Tax=Pseudomonas protegens TaxID=380021 RepID=UPI001F24B285|nr:hypothetical protein [Pseudomonas protegens]